MAKTRTYTCPTTNTTTPLVANLYPHSRGQYGKWRYKTPDGKNRDIWRAIEQLDAEVVERPLSVDEAVEAAKLLNNELYSTDKPSFLNGRMTQQVEQYILEREADKETLLDSANWKQARNYLRKMASQLNTVGLKNLDRDTLYNWFRGNGDYAYRQQNNGCSRDALANQRKHYAAFFGWLIGRNFCPKLTDNPFKPNSNGEIKLPQKIVKHSDKNIYRRPMSLGDFKQISAIAVNDDRQWLADCMLLALYTSQRKSDLVTLRLTDWDKERNTIIFLNVKKYEQTGEKLGQIFDLNKPQFKPLLSLLERLEARAKLLGCPFFICEPTGDKAATKVHHAQVLPDRVNKIFKQCRDQIKDISWARKAKNNRSEPTTFHEIRSLSGRILEEEGLSTSAIQNRYGHSGADTTLHYLGKKFDRVNICKAGFDIDSIDENFELAA